MEAYEGAISSKSPNVNLLDKCIERCAKILTYYPNSKWADDAVFLSGKCFYAKEEINQAEIKFKELINFYPESEYVSESEVFLGKIALERDDDVEAERWFSRASEDKRVKEEVEFWLTNSYFLSESYERAIKMGESYLSSFNKGKYKVEVLLILGEASDSLKRYAEALNYYEMAIPLVENEFDFVLKVGDIYLKMDDIDKAKEIFESILPMDNEEEILLKGRIALCYETEGDYEKAVSILQELDNQESKFRIGMIYEKQLKLQDALESYNEAINKAPNTDLGKEGAKKVKSIEEVLCLWEILGTEDTLYIEPIQNDSTFIIEDTLPQNLEGDTMEITYVQEDSIAEIIADTLLVDTITDISVTDTLITDTLITDTLIVDTTVIDTLVIDTLVADTIVTDTLVKDTLKYEIVTGDTTSRPDTVIDMGSVRMRLAEIWLLEFENADEALKEYMTVVDEFSESEYVPKALYAIAWIEHNIKKNQESALSRYKVILRDYPDTDYAIAARRQIGIIEQREE